MDCKRVVEWAINCLFTPRGEFRAFKKNKRVRKVIVKTRLSGPARRISPFVFCSRDNNSVAKRLFYLYIRKELFNGKRQRKM